MGQRSQIYIRFENKKHEKQLVARYYGWNYGERMVSRGRGIIEWLLGNLQYDWQLEDAGFLTKLRRICDINFDMHDIVLSQCIIEEFKEYEDNFSEFNNYVFFEQGNNDGKLFIDILPDFSIRYAFTSCDLEKYEPLDGDGYMIFDRHGDDGKWDIETEYFDRQTINYTKKNIRYIRRKAQLMSKEQLKEFAECDYTHLIPEMMPFH